MMANNFGLNGFQDKKMSLILEYKIDIFIVILAFFSLSLKVDLLQLLSFELYNINTGSIRFFLSQPNPKYDSKLLKWKRNVALIDKNLIKNKEDF